MSGDTRSGRAAVTKLSLPARRITSERPLAPDEIRVLLSVADCLIPGGLGDPKASEAPEYLVWLTRAINARAESFSVLLEALHLVVENSGQIGLRDALRDMNENQPEHFHLMSSVVAGAYLMVPAVMSRIGYPGQKRNPADVDEALNQLGDGILDPVIERGHIYRDVF